MQRRNIVTTDVCTDIMTGTLFFLPRYFTVGFWQSMNDPAARGVYQWILFVCLLPASCGLLLTVDR
jgi:hypothetical protein